VNTLRHIIYETTPRLEEAVATHPFYSVEPLSAPSCGYSTALLQRRLARLGFRTTRLIAQPQSLPPSVDGTPREHVILLSDTGIVIDPTYRQFLNLVGYNSLHITAIPSLVNFLPEKKIAAFNQSESKEFGRQFGKHVIGSKALIAATIMANCETTGQPYTRYLNEHYAPISTFDSDEIMSVYEGVWNLGEYSPYPTDLDDVATGTFRRAEAVMNK
jgi:hypothetical protein